MRIVISGYYGFENIGDEAILYAIIRSLRELNPKIEVTVFSGNPTYTKEKHQVDAVNRWNLKELIFALKKADLMISGGGSLFQDQTSNKNVWYYAGVIKLARWLKKPVLVYAQGIGPINRKQNQLIVKRVFQSVQLISVRDAISKKSLENFGVTLPVHIVPDPVMGIDPLDLRSEWLAASNITQKKLVVSIRAWKQNLSYLRKIAEALDDLAAKGYAIILVPMHEPYDEITSRQLKKLMRQEVYIAPRNSSINEKIAIIKESEVLLGMRLHALIFAAISNTPFVALSYDPKIDAFTSIVEQTLIGNVEDAGWSANDIINSVDNIMDNYAEEQERLKAYVTVLRKRSNYAIQDMITSMTDL